MTTQRCRRWLLPRLTQGCARSRRWAMGPSTCVSDGRTTMRTGGARLGAFRSSCVAGGVAAFTGREGAARHEPSVCGRRGSGCARGRRPAVAEPVSRVGGRGGVESRRRGGGSGGRPSPLPTTTITPSLHTHTQIHTHTHPLTHTTARAMGKQALLKQNDSDVVIVSAVRTPITRVRRFPFPLSLAPPLAVGLTSSSHARSTRLDPPRPERVVSRMPCPRISSSPSSRRRSTGRASTRS
jgi:hypothetical protein